MEFTNHNSELKEEERDILYKKEYFNITRSEWKNTFEYEYTLRDDIYGCTAFHCVKKETTGVIVETYYILYSNDFYRIPFSKLSTRNMSGNQKQPLTRILSELCLNRIFAIYSKLQFEDIKRGLCLEKRGSNSMKGKISTILGKQNIIKKVDPKTQKNYYERIRNYTPYATRSIFNEKAAEACRKRAIIYSNTKTIDNT